MALRIRALCLSLLLIGGLFAATGFVGATTFVESQHEDLEPNTVVIDFEVTDDGTGEWTISHRYRLSNESEETAFEELSAEVAENSSAYRDRFRDRMDPTIAAAENATGRDMAIENLSVDTERTSIPQTYGIVRYTFEWTGFAALEDDRMLVGDAISGLFLDEQSTLHVRWGESWDLETVSPSATEDDDRRVTWRGPNDFGDDQPRVELTRRSGWLSTGLLAFTALGLLALLGVGGAVWWRRSGATTVAEPTPDDELLSNEEQVLQLLETEDGRMKQQEVVQRLGWTDAKTSQVISDLRERGDIETFRLGRENVIRLPEETEES